MYVVLQPQVCRNHRSAHKSVEFTTPALTFQYSILIIFQFRNKMKSVFKTYSPCFKPIALVNYLTRLDCSRTSTAICLQLQSAHKRRWPSLAGSPIKCIAGSPIKCMPQRSSRDTQGPRLVTRVSARWWQPNPALKHCHTFCCCAERLCRVPTRSCETPLFMDSSKAIRSCANLQDWSTQHPSRRIS